MSLPSTNWLRRLTWVSVLLMLLLLVVMVLGMSAGSSGFDLIGAWQAMLGKSNADSILPTIIWRLRFPRVLMAALLGATLSLGGLVFQAILRNPLAEPYILGISGGSAIGAIIGILMGFSRFPGVGLSAFAGSMGTLVVLLYLSAGGSLLKKDTLLLAGVMVNAFCTAVISFLISMTQDSRLHNIIFWLIGDLSLVSGKEAALMAGIILPCFLVIFLLAHTMNLLLLGRDMAVSMGVNFKLVVLTLLIITSFMVSMMVSQTGLVGFVGLVTPHVLRLMLGPDHRVLIPSCILGGGAFMVTCDLLARVLPQQGEMPAGVITALIGAPLFIYLLKKEST